VTETASYVLSLQFTGRPAQSFELQLPRAIIGREVGDLVIADPMCSSKHAELLFANGTVVLRDLGSTNGTWVNGQRVQELQLGPGINVVIGAAVLSLVQVKMPGQAFGRTMVAAPGHFAAQASAPAPAAQRPAQAPPPMQAAKKSSPMPLLLGALALLVVGVVGGSAVLWVKSTKLAAPAVPGQVASAPAASKPSSLSDLLPSMGSKPGVLSGPRETTVRALWFRGEAGGQVEGGTSPVKVKVAPNTNAGVSVGVIEEFSGGSGDMWKTSVWLAAFNASRVAGVGLADNEFLVRAGGHIDGPSAGMLMTSTMLALLRNKELRPDTTMTGTINPDGSAGPVGGIVQKMEGAKASGIKRFGFPMGSRNHKDLRSLQDVDLMDVGARLGLEVHEIHDLYEGYEFMTGEALPRTAPVADSELELSSATQGLLRAKITGWKSRVDGELAKLKQEAARASQFKQFIGPMVGEAETAYNTAQRYESSDFLQAALIGYVKTAVALKLSHNLLRALQYIAAGDLKGLADMVEVSAAGKGQVAAYGQAAQVRAVNRTVGGQLSTVFAYDAYVQASAFTGMADDSYARALEVQKKLKSGELKLSGEAMQYVLMNMVMPPTYYDAALIYLDYAKDEQELISDEGSAAPMSDEAVEKLATAYASASGAVLAYLESLITAQVGEGKSMSKAQVQGAIADKEMGYLLALQMSRIAENEAQKGAQGSRLLKLAAGAHSYLSGAGLVNKYYSIQATKNEKGELVLTNRKALTAQLDLARANAREAAARSKAAVGIVPTATKLAFQMGNAQREGADEDKLEALENYWQAAFWSDLAAGSTR
jgi:predicted S18 family serine protease